MTKVFKTFLFHESIMRYISCLPKYIFCILCFINMLHKHAAPLFPWNAVHTQKICDAISLTHVLGNLQCKCMCSKK